MKKVIDGAGVEVPEFVGSRAEAPEYWRTYYEPFNGGFRIRAEVLDAIEKTVKEHNDALDADRAKLAELDAKNAKAERFIAEQKLNNALSQALVGVVAPRFVNGVVALMKADANLAVRLDKDQLVVNTPAGGVAPFSAYLEHWRDTDEGKTFGGSKPREPSTLLVDELNRVLH
jgi:hypothetical protein